ncbi:MAG: hypothetical protein ACJ78Q_07450 [Chloroflexia bacterium]
MNLVPFNRSEDGGLTRISVKSTLDCYLVKHGDEPPVRVYRRRRGLECECGVEACKHIASLQLCGFVGALGELPGESRRAA